jgi:hypothetical protein
MIQFLGYIGSFKWKIISTNGYFRLQIYLRANKTLIHSSLYVFKIRGGVDLNHKKMQCNFSTKMIIRRAKPIRIIAVLLCIVLSDNSLRFFTQTFAWRQPALHSPVFQSVMSRSPPVFIQCISVTAGCNSTILMTVPEIFSFGSQTHLF